MMLRHLLRALLGLFLIFAGLSHLTWARGEFQAQVPSWVPLNIDLVVILSGLVEITLGSTLLLAKRYRKEAGLVTAIFFVMIFPGNVHQYLNGIDAFGLDSDRARMVRLFFQPVLILWAIWSTRAKEEESQ